MHVVEVTIHQKLKVHFSRVSDDHKLATKFEVNLGVDGRITKFEIEIHNAKPNNNQLLPVRFRRLALRKPQKNSMQKDGLT